MTPVPMNQLALANAKAGPDEHVADLERLEQLEQWAAAYEAREVLAFEVEHPEAAAYAAGVHVAAKDRHRLAELEAWALSQPYRPADPQAEAEQARRRRWDQADTYDARLSAWMAQATPCEHRSCLVGACKYRAAG